MTPFTHRLRTFIPLICTLLTLLCDGLRFLFLCLRPSPTLAAEHLFLRKQLALYQERQIRPHRPTQATRMALTWLARWFDWRQVLAVVQPNALCERLLGTLRQECLDFLIPLTEHHLRRLLRAWVCHYNAGRPHMALGPGIPQPPPPSPVPLQTHRHRLPPHLPVVARSILGGLHHAYRLDMKVA